MLELIRTRLRLQKQVFGAKSERIIADLGQQSFFFDETEETLTEELEQVSYHRRKSVKNKGCDTISYPDDLPVKRIELDVPEEQKVCAQTGEPLTRIGEEVSGKLARKAEQFYIIEYIRPKYASRKNPDQGLLTAPPPDAMIDRGPADENLLASILVAKYADHVPLYRQMQMMRRSDIRISRQTLLKWVLTLSTGLEPLYDVMRSRVLQSGVIFVGESPVNLQSEKKGLCKKAYMWIYVGGGGGDPPYRFFDFRTSRSHAHVEQTLQGYKGILHSDKYAAYEKLAKRDDIIWCPCMAHARRKFVEAENGDPELRSRILHKIRYLFLFERVRSRRAPAHPAREGKADSGEPDSAYHRSHSSRRPAAESQIYPGPALLSGTGTVLYPLSGKRRCPARQQCHRAGDAAAGYCWKNWTFAGSEDGGKAGAIMLSLIQTCRHLNVNPQDYLEDVLRRPMSHPASRIEELLPDQWLVASKENSSVSTTVVDGLS